MAFGSIGRVTAETSNCCAEWRAGAQPFWLRTVKIVNAATTASIYSLRRPGAIGVGPTELAIPIWQGPGSIVAKLAVAWSTTKPTSGADELFFHTQLTGAIGYTVDFDFTRNGNQGIYVPANSSILLWGHSTVAAVYVSAQIQQ